DDVAGSRGVSARYAHFVDIRHATAGNDPAKDGKLIQRASAYAGVGYDSTAFPSTSRRELTRRGKEIWNRAVGHFQSLSSPLPSDVLTQLKHTVTEYFKYRAHMAENDFPHAKWGGTVLADIPRAAAQQYADLGSLWQAYDRLIACEDRSAAQQNRTYFDLFYPFFRNVITVDEMELQHHTQARRPHSQAPFQAQAYTPPGLPASSSAGPYGSAWAPGAAGAFSSASAHHGGGPASGYPGRLASGQRGPAMGGGFAGQSFMGKPLSHSVVGSTLGIHMPGVSACLLCPGGPPHFSWECPIRYFRKFQCPCPGFDHAGNRLQGAWHGNSITSQTKAAWRAFISQYGLSDSHRAGNRTVDFS
ncbi:MAG: hypothetical protein RIR91_1787, partial [Verrucomicrobiota bacterium]